MLKTIIDLLKADASLSSLKAITGEYGRDIPFIRYEYTPLTNDGVKGQIRLELTAVAGSLGESLEIMENVNKALITIGDDELTGDIKSVRQNGGGQLYNDDTKTWHTKKAYSIIYRERG